MKKIITNTVLPILCAAVFCGAGLFGLIPASNSEAKEAHDDAAMKKDDKKESETVQHSFPVFSETEKIGHCVLAVRTNLREAEFPYADQGRVEQRHIIYKSASGILGNAEDGHKACKQLFDIVSADVEVTEHVFLVN